MSDHELTEDDHEEINVLDTDSRLSHSESEPRTPCSSPEAGRSVSSPRTSVSSSHALPFSISNLLGKNFEDKHELSEPTVHPMYQQPSIFPGHRGVLPTGFYAAQGGVLRVPAHRPLGGPGSPGAVFSPWALGLDPVLQRSAAAAAFATQVVKDRLSGKNYL